MKIRINAGLIIFFIASAILLSVTVSGEKVSENAQSKKGGGNLNPGVVLLGAESKQGFGRFTYMLRDRLVQGFAFFPFGWGPITPEEGVYNWSEMDEVVKNAKAQDEKIAAAFWSAGHSYEHSPQWLYYKYNLRLITSQGAFVNFEDTNLYRGFEILSGGRLTGENTQEILSQTTSLVGENGPFLSSEKITLKKGYPQSLGFDYKILENGTFQVVMENDDGSKVTLWEKQLLKGTLASKMILIPQKELTKYKRIIWIAKSGKISIDNVNISPMIPGVWGVPVAYPNYFDPIYKQKYEAFVVAMKEHYKDNPTLAAVYVGGYGRWDEVGIDAGFLNEGVEDNRLVAEQWYSYGYSDDKYVAHVKWCADLYKKYFGNTDKNIIMQSIASGVPGSTSYINWQVINYAVSLGFGIKVNGLSEMCTEFNQDTSQYFWINSRYKNELYFYHEEGGQINNTLSPVMGHPLSLVNRLIIDSIDYYWMYDADIYEPYVRKYLHYANEQAGSSLVNKMYSIMGAFPYRSTLVATDYTHYNLWTGIYTKNSAALKYGKLDGVTYAETTNAAKSIKMSVDDRQKWRGMYGNTITVDYYDEGTDEFSVKVMVPRDGSVNGVEKTLGNIKRTDTKLWKSVSFYDSEFVNDKRSGGFDMPIEIILDAADKQALKVRNVELNYVPTGDYKKVVIQDRQPIKSKVIPLQKEATSFNIKLSQEERLAEIAVPLTEISGKIVNIAAKVYYISAGGAKTLLTEKNLYNPGTFCYLPIPVASAPPNISEFAIELSVSQGTGGAYSDGNGGIAYQTSSYIKKDTQKEELVNIRNGEGTIEALTDFYGLKIKGSGEFTFTFSKKLPDGKWMDKLFTTTMNIDKEKNWYFEPQTSGIYKITVQGNTKNLQASTLPLERIETPNEPTRYNLGKKLNTSIAQFSEDLWIPKSGLKNMSYHKESFTALLDGKNPTIETQHVLNVTAGKRQIFNFIMKNETNSPLTKLYWKTAAEDFYSESKSAVIPTVSNDTQFREYSWPIGAEASWTGIITGLKFMPVTGHTGTGRISIHSLSIHDDDLVNYEKKEPLKISEIKPEARIYFESKQENKFIIVLLVVLGFVIVLIGAIFAGVFFGTKKKRETTETV